MIGSIIDGLGGLSTDAGHMKGSARIEIELVLVDTGPLIALYESSDLHHGACRDQARKLRVGKADTCWPVLTEAAYRLRRYPRERARLFEAVRDGICVLLPLGAQDTPGIEAIFGTYHGQEVDIADACLVHFANREGIARVLTLDRRHFSVSRMANGRPFELLAD